MSSSDTNLRILEVNGHQIACLAGNPRGAGPPLVFLHGIIGSVYFWPPLLTSPVVKNRRWYSVGLPGHDPGRFPRDHRRADITPEMFADVLAAAIRELEPHQPVGLVGYSTGGFAALNLAARAPELVAAVLSISGFAVGRWHSLLGNSQSLARHGLIGRQLFKAGFSVVAANSWLFKKLLLANARTKVERSSADVRQLLDVAAADAKRHNRNSLANLFAQIRGFDIRPSLANIRAPTIIAGGDRDPIIPVASTRELAAAVPQAELVELAGVGHLFFVECRDEFERLFEDWITRHLPVAGSLTTDLASVGG